jgi:hypothetical protein
MSKKQYNADSSYDSFAATGFVAATTGTLPTKLMDNLA